MDPKLLSQLSVVVDCGSLRKAAERLHLTAPTLSRNIKIIEDKVGSPILQRSSTGVIPTPVGQQLADVGRAILQNMGQANEIVDRWRSGLGRELKIGAGSLISYAILGGFFAKIMAERIPYPIAVRTTSAPRVISQVRSGEFDIGLAPANVAGPIDDLHRDLLIKDRTAIFAGPNNPLSQRKGRVSARDLSQQTWLNVGPQSGVFGDVDLVLKRQGIEKKVAPIDFAGYIEMPIKMAHDSNVILALPRKLAQLTPFVPGLVEIQVDFELPLRDIVLWTQPANRYKPEVTHIVEKLRSYVDAHT